MPTTKGDTVLKKGQSLQDIVQGLMGAESDIAGRSNAPPFASRISPTETQLPDFNQIMAGMPSSNMQYQFPGMRWDPNASKGRKIFQAITSLMGSVDPMNRAMMNQRNKFIFDQRKADYQNAIRLYGGAMRGAEIRAREEEARVRGLNEDIADYNKRVGDIMKHPKAWDILKEALRLQGGVEKSQQNALDRGDKASTLTLRHTNEFLNKTLPKFLEVPDLKFGGINMSGKQPVRQLDPNNPKDVPKIQKIINSPGFKARLQASGADPMMVWHYLHGQYGKMNTLDPATGKPISVQGIDDDASTWFGNDISPALRLEDTKPSGRIPSSGTQDSLHLNDPALDPQKGENALGYTRRLRTAYSGDTSKAYAHMLYKMFGNQMAGLPGLKSYVTQKAVADQIRAAGGDPQKVMQEFDNLRLQPPPPAPVPVGAEDDGNDQENDNDEDENQ